MQLIGCRKKALAACSRIVGEVSISSMTAGALVVLLLPLLVGTVTDAATEPLSVRLLTPSVQDRGQGWLQVQCRAV